MNNTLFITVSDKALIQASQIMTVQHIHNAIHMYMLTPLTAPAGHMSNMLQFSFENEKECLRVFESIKKQLLSARGF